MSYASDALIDAQEREIEKLKAENAKLRDERERMYKANVEKNGEIMRLLEENSKLRELAILNWEWAHSCCGNTCKLQTEGCGYQIDRECNYEREIYDLMREVGIEVD